MPSTLPLGLSEKSEVPALARSSGGITESQRTRVPQGVEQAQPPAELAHALSAPGEMIGLLARRPCERFLDVIVRRRERLSLVKGLGTHFPAMVHPHQGRSIAAYFVAKIFLGHGISRTGSARDRLSVQDPQGPVELDDAAVQFEARVL